MSFQGTDVQQLLLRDLGWKLGIRPHQTPTMAPYGVFFLLQWRRPMALGVSRKSTASSSFPKMIEHAEKKCHSHWVGFKEDLQETHYFYH